MRHQLSAIAAALLTAFSGASMAQQKAISDDVVKIGVLTDLSGIYQELAGKGSIEAARMAVEDFGGKVLGKKIEVIFTDTQLKPDVAATTARKWFDEDGVDMVTDVAGSAAALAVIEVARQKDRIAIVSSAAASDITGAKCTPNSVHYVIDTNAIAKALGTAMMKQGGDSWYFLSADNAFGKALERDVGEVVTKLGGKVVGGARHPANPSDFSSFVLQAQSSGAKVIALSNAGADFTNAMKSAREFGIGKDGKQTLAGMLIFIGDVHSMGLQTAQGLTFTTAFYWDENDDTRKFAKRFYDRVGKMPYQTHASVYSSTLHYLNAIKAAGTDSAGAVMRKMKDTPVNDFFSRGGRIREDGLMAHDLLLVQVKKPAESKGTWDYYNILQKIPAADAYKPASESTCPLVKK
jgi:branched-chain amino acid transport system substrate-binding protein